MTDPIDGYKPIEGASVKKRPKNRRGRRRRNGQFGHFGQKQNQAQAQASNLLEGTSGHQDSAKGEMQVKMHPPNDIHRQAQSVPPQTYRKPSSYNKSAMNGSDLSAPAQNNTLHKPRHTDGGSMGHSSMGQNSMNNSSIDSGSVDARSGDNKREKTYDEGHADNGGQHPRHHAKNSNAENKYSGRKKSGKPYYKSRYSSKHKPRNNAPLYGALDLGTNNCRLLIARPLNRGRFRVVDAYSRIVRLGEGMTTTGCIGENAMDRAIEALKACRKKLEFRQVTRHRLIATQACRMADNCEEFLSRVRNEAGIELEIVDQKTEARLAVSGCGSLVDRTADGVVVFDIGGGSSELALLDTENFRARKIAQHIKAWTSLPLGVVTLSERHGGHEITPQVFQSMIDEVTGHLAQFKERHALDSAQKSGKFHLLGTSGTVTTLAGVHLNLPRYDRRRIDGIWLEDCQIDDMVQKIMDMGFKGRVANPCIGGERADLVLAGCAILQAIRAVWPAERLRVADRGLREGILTELMYQDGVWRRNPPSTNSQKHSG